MRMNLSHPFDAALPRHRKALIRRIGRVRAASKRCGIAPQQTWPVLATVAADSSAHLHKRRHIWDGAATVAWGGISDREEWGLVVEKHRRRRSRSSGTDRVTVGHHELCGGHGSV